MAHRALHTDSRPGASWRAKIFAVAGLLLCAASATMAQEGAATDSSEQLLRLARTVASNAAMQLEASTKLFEITAQKYDAGTSTHAEFRQALLTLNDAEMRLKLAELDVEEIEATRGPVRVDPEAPLIDGRDFFSERLEIQFESISRQSANLEETIELAELRISAGTATGDSITPLTIERSLLATEAEQIRTTLAMRRNIVALMEPEQVREK